MDKIVIAYICDKLYLPLLKISIESIKRYNKNVEFVILSKDYFKVDDVKVFTFDTDFKNFKFKPKDRMREAVYYKFWLPILPYDKILFLDCDTICQRPLNELWNIDCPFICATESHSYGKVQAKQLGLQKYALSGMMLMNLEALRKENFTEKCLNRLNKEKIVNQHDETIINLEFNNKIKFIDVKYNYCRNRKYDNPINEQDAYILHYVGEEQKREMLKIKFFQSLNKLKPLLENKTVAIIGNSTKIFDKKDGQEIDNHDIVIRFNKGFPENKESQGSRTDILFLACTLNNIELNKYKAKYTVRRSMFCGTKCNFDLQQEERSVYIQESNKECKIQHLNKSQASTGFLGVQFVLSTNYKKLDLYGFDFFKSPTYYNPKGYKTMHNGDKEGEKVLEYQKYNLLEIH